MKRLPPSFPSPGGSRRTPLTLRLYQLALFLYPPAFRRVFGRELWQTGRDAYEEASVRGPAGLALLWLSLGVDTLRSAIPERLNAMRPTLVLAPIMTGLAFVVSLIVSVHLLVHHSFQFLTIIRGAAWVYSPWVGLSVNGPYIADLVAGVAVCALVAYTLAPANRLVTVGLGVVALVVALVGAVGDPALFYFPAFAMSFLLFVALALVSLLVGRAVVDRLQPRVPPRAAALIGGCASVGIVLLFNVVTLTAATFVGKPYAQGLHPLSRLGDLTLSPTVLALGGQVPTMLVCLGSIVVAIRASASPTPGTAC